MNKIIAICLFLIISRSFSQISISPQISTFYTDNLYRSPQKTGDWLSNFAINLVYEHPNFPFSFNLVPEYNWYKEHTQQNFAFVNTSLEYYPFLDKNEIWQFYGSLDWATRLNKEDYKFYNYQQLRMSVALYRDGDFALNQWTYQLQWRNFDQYDALSSVSNYFNWQFNKPLPTRTTLIANVGLASRYYENQIRYIVINDTLDWSNWRSSGRNQRPPKIITRTIPVNSNPVNLNQLQCSIRLAQNILPTLGVYLQYRKSFDLASSGLFQNYASYLGDDELFDDPLSYLNNEWSSQITWLMPGRWKLQLHSSFNRKRYLKETAFISENDLTGSGNFRRDTKIDCALNLSKKFTVKDKLTLNLDGQIYYVQNQSNSYWFDYTNLIWGLNLNLIFLQGANNE